MTERYCDVSHTTIVLWVETIRTCLRGLPSVEAEPMYVLTTGSISICRCFIDKVAYSDAPHYNTIVEDVHPATSPGHSVSIKLLKPGCSAADVKTRHTPPPPLIRYTNHLFGHQRRYTKRLTIRTKLYIGLK